MTKIKSLVETKIAEQNRQVRVNLYLTSTTFVRHPMFEKVRHMDKHTMNMAPKVQTIKHPRICLDDEALFNKLLLRQYHTRNNIGYSDFRSTGANKLSIMQKLNSVPFDKSGEQLMTIEQVQNIQKFMGERKRKSRL